MALFHNVDETNGKVMTGANVALVTFFGLLILVSPNSLFTSKADILE